jgi:hypothetical protein
MKTKFICLLILFSCSLAASPNSYCDGTRCTGRSVKAKTASPARPVVMVIDEMELLPIHYFINNF